MNKLWEAPAVRLFTILILLVSGIFALPSDTHAYTPDTYFWASPNLTYAIDSSYTALGANYTNALNDAISDWSNSSTPVTFTYNSSSLNVIKAGNLGLNGGLASTQNFDRYPTGTNFHYGPAGVILNMSYLSTFYVGPRSSSIPADKYDLRTILRHELGHVIGLCHTWNSPLALEDPNSNLGVVTGIDQDASQGVKYIFGPDNFNTPPEGGCGSSKDDGAPLFASAGSYDDRYPDGTRRYQITYGNRPSWLQVGYTPSWWNAAGQTLSYTNLYNARATIVFNGSRITRRSTMASNRGKAEIYLDGQLAGTVNDNAAETRWQIASTWTYGSNGRHTFEVRNIGGAGSGYIDVDGFIIDANGLSTGTYDDSQVSSIQYIGSWTASSGFSSASGGTIHYSNTTSASAGTTFYGNRVTYYYTAAPNRGKAWVTIDGQDFGYIDLYSGTTQWQRSISWPLASGYHTIFVGVSGQKNPSASDTYVDLDKFVVNGF